MPEPDYEFSPDESTRTISRLQLLRLNRRLTTYRLAEIAGVAQGAIFRHEKGLETLSEADLERLARTLCARVSQISGRVER